MKEQTASSIDMLHEYAAQNLRWGFDPSDLIRQLISNGVDPVRAVEVVRQAEHQLLRQHATQTTSRSRQTDAPSRSLLSRISPRVRLLALLVATISIYMVATAAPLPRSFRPPSSIIGTAEELSGDRRLVITNNATEDSVVFLVRDTGTLATAYVRANETFTMAGVPKGEYVLYFARGRDWNGRTFNHSTKQRRFTQQLNYHEYLAYELIMDQWLEDETPSQAVSDSELPAVPSNGQEQP